ncbi:RluA family pseudouridine synthase [Candidatus Falkowbacteria bacterium]|nr:RluA family pseudouridine synthase [Candidatus Falkowbacteria bacterium]
MEYTISQNQAGNRLDKFLTEAVGGTTRSQLQKSIKDGSVLVNGQPTTPHQFLKTGDVVTFGRTKEKKTKEKPAATKTKMPEVEIIGESDDYIVVNKPSGLLVHGDEHTTEPTLATWLLSKYPDVASVGDDPFRPGIVHRLDKDVSGLMVIAKNQKFFNKIKKQFQNRTIFKRYTALAYGKVARDEFTINFNIERATSGHKMAAKPTNQEGKEAESEVAVIKRYINYTLAKVRIKTGRTHQIRAHLAAYGNPIVGDQVYGTSTAKKMNAKLKTDRIYLVSDELTFKDAANKKQSFTIELPEAFAKMLTIIK